MSVHQYESNKTLTFDYDILQNNLYNCTPQWYLLLMFLCICIELVNEKMPYIELTHKTKKCHFAYKRVKKSLVESVWRVE